MTNNTLTVFNDVHVGPATHLENLTEDDKPTLAQELRSTLSIKGSDIISF